MKKVLHVIPCLRLGGTEAYVMSHYRNMPPEFQCDFAVFALQESPYLEEIRENGNQVFVIGQPSLKTVHAFGKKLRKILNEKGPYDVVHCHGNASNGIPLLFSAIYGVKKRISHSHAVCEAPKGFGSKMAYFLRKMLIQICATDLFACSTGAGESLFGKKTFSRKGVVCENGIAVQSFLHPQPETIASLKEEFEIQPETQLVLGNISRFDANKNQMFAIDVFREIVKKVPQSVLILGGVDGGMLEQVRNHIAQYGLCDQVRLIGPRQDVASCLHVMDVHLFPSHEEGFGIAVLEAQAADCLCVTSTGVPQKVDMGLGNVVRLPLQMGAACWAEKILERLPQKKKTSKDQIAEAFVQKGYDITISAKRLAELYDRSR